MFSLRIAWLAVSMATGMPMAVSATWTIIAPVQTRPKRSVAPPVPRFARCGCTRARVTFSAGRNDNIAALTTARPPAYRIVESFRPGVIQNGAPPAGPVDVFDPPRQRPVGGNETDRSRDGREHKGLHEELTDDARAARTERGTHGDFPLPCRRPRVDQRADARARNDQHQQHRQVRHRELRDVRDIRPFTPKSHHARSEMLVRRRKRRGRPFAEHAQLGVRLLPRDARSQPADDADRTALERIVRGPERQWRPGIVVDRVAKTLRHDTDHGRRCVPQFHDRSEDVLPAAEGALPHVVAEHDHAGCSRHFVGVEQGTTEQGRHTCRAERGGRELRHLDRLGSRVTDDEISSVRAVCPQILDRSQLAPPFEEVARDARLGLVCQGILRLDQDEAVAFGQRDRRRQDLTDRSYQPAPIPIAMASASPPASVRPGYFRSIRSPSL